MIALLDTGVIVSGIFWRNEAHRCLVALARRKFSLALSESVYAEYERTVWSVRATVAVETDPQIWLDFLRHRALWFDTTPLQKSVCRDPKDDMFVECALASSAICIVSRDQDLLALEKPCGIEIVTPRKFLSVLAQRKPQSKKGRL